MTTYDPQDQVDRMDRIMRHLDQKLYATHGSRADLYISDTQELDRDSCYAMLRYAEGLPCPTTAEVVDFIGRNFGGKIRPIMETCRNFSDHNSVLLMLAKHQPTRKLDDVKDMHTVVAGARYLDVEMRDTWDVAVMPDGTKFLRRCGDDDVLKMVADRRQRMQVSAGTAELTIARALGAGTSTADVGDIVRVYHQGNLYSDCEIKTAQANRLSVRIPNVGTVTLAREAVVEVQAISKDRASKMKNQLEDYYRKVFPDPKYAEQLTQKLTDEGHEPAMPSYWTKPSR